MNSLSLVPTKDLINELANRHEHFVLMGMRTRIKGPTDYETLHKWSGNAYVCRGMLKRLDDRISDRLWEIENDNV